MNVKITTDSLTDRELHKSGNEFLNQGEITMQKIQVKEITITRAEGPSAECGNKHVVTSFADSERILSAMSRTAPQGGGYDKTDFTVTFEDGESYTGRYDLKYERDETIAEHMTSFLMWYAGLTQNPHCGQIQYEAFLARQAPEEIAEAKAFLETYQIG